MIRHAPRALGAAGLVIVPPALTVTPAHAVTTCRVSGVTVTGTTVNGTSGSDSPRCDSLAGGDVVNGQGGADPIVTTGAIGGTARGGTGRDRFPLYREG